MTDTLDEVDEDAPTTCPRCKSLVTIECGYEPSKHPYCWPCASEILDEILSSELPREEGHLKAVVHVDHEQKKWVQAPPLGCVAIPLARAFARSILQACDKAERDVG